MWMKQKKATKSRVTINIETAKAELIKETASQASKAYTSFIRAKINLLLENAIKWQTEFNHVFTEMLVMIDGVD